MPRTHPHVTAVLVLAALAVLPASTEGEAPGRAGVEDRMNALESVLELKARISRDIVGQETDGSVTPYDLDMGWIVSQTKDFIGRRSLSRADMGKSDRKQLVGIGLIKTYTVVVDNVNRVAFNVFF